MYIRGFYSPRYNDVLEVLAWRNHQTCSFNHKALYGCKQPHLQRRFFAYVRILVECLCESKTLLPLLPCVIAPQTDNEFLAQERPQTTLLIIGDGPEREALEKKVRNLHLEGKVRFLGRLDKKALGESIKASDLFVLNTSYEGLSHQLLEVMELGVPIVSTRVGGNPELIRDEISGILVEPCDTEVLSKVIARLLDNEQLRQRMVQNARVRLQDFTQEREAAHFVELLSRIVTH